MCSTPSRFSDASHALRTYSGLPLMPRKAPSSPRSLPNFVASTTSSRRPAIARPVDGGDGLVLVGGAVELGHPHAAEALGGHLETLAAELACLHGVDLAA